VARVTVILDTCVLINLLASGEFESIIDSRDEAFVICSKAQEETIYLRPDNTETGSLEPIALDALLNSNTLQLVLVENEREESLYVDYAAHLDDGEAMSLALAEARGFLLATDDNKARRLFAEAIGTSDSLVSTPDLMRGWAESRSISPKRLKSAVSRIMYRARFTPSRQDPNFSWWCDAAR
jgi:predicted nucleic acid-binding protein